MRVIETVIGGLWVAFWVYWLASAAGAKATRGRSNRLIGVRVALVIVVVVLIHTGVLGRKAVTSDRAMGMAGLVIVLLGLALAVWARVYLGRNWGMPMTQRVDPELITGGPYRRIRHPIYTGIILAMIGTAIAISGYGLIPVALLSTYFIFSARTEERFLAREFPDSYPEYQRSTKMLIPFVF